MPSTSGTQHRFMAMCKHSPQHAEGKCPPEKVASEFVQADKGKKFGRFGAKDQAKALKKKGA